MSEFSDLKSLINDEQYGILATASLDAEPHTNLMAFAVTDDIKKIILVTPQNTRKYTNILENPRVSFMIDSRPARGNANRGRAVSVSGKIYTPSKDEADLFLSTFIKRHPQMREFTELSEATVIVLDAETFYYIDDLYRVTVFRS